MNFIVEKNAVTAHNGKHVLLFATEEAAISWVCDNDDYVSRDARWDREDPSPTDAYVPSLTIGMYRITPAATV